MKKNVLLKISSFLMAAAAAAGMAGNGENAMGAAQSAGITMSQQAVWSDEENLKAELIIKISGLRTYAAEEAAVLPAQSEDEDSTEENTPDGTDNTEAVSIPDGTDSTEAAAAPDEPDSEEILNIPDETDNAEEASPDEAGSLETGDAEGNGSMDEAGVQSAETGNLTFSAVCFLSEYFVPDEERMPSAYIVEEQQIAGENGGQTITRITVPITKETYEGEEVSLSVPVALKEEYRFPGGQTYPVNREVSFAEGETGAGAYLIKDGTGEILAGTGAAFLQTTMVNAGLSVAMEADRDTMKAGESLTYKITLVNTGDVDLTRLTLRHDFSLEGPVYAWEAAEGLTDLQDGCSAVLDALKKGETRILYGTVQIPEEQENGFTDTLSLQTRDPADPQSHIEKQVQVQTSVTPLKADFTVEKTADRTYAMPGDTVIYQICIRNTGEKTLHSVLSTERFLTSDIQAVFLAQEGVEINAAGNRALIPQILPGEAAALKASVTLPMDLASQELINEVIVVSRETGTRSVQSQAGIQVTAPAPAATATPTPWPTRYVYQSAAKSAGYASKPVSSYPKTADGTPVAGWTAALAVSFAAGTAAFALRKRKRKH